MRFVPFLFAIDPLAEFIARGPQAEEMLSPVGTSAGIRQPGAIQDPVEQRSQAGHKAHLSIYRGVDQSWRPSMPAQADSKLTDAAPLRTQAHAHALPSDRIR